MRHATTRFFGFAALTFLLLALVPAVQVLAGIDNLDFNAMARAASARTGAPWTSNLLDIIVLASAEPGLWLLVLGSAVPTLAALAMLALGRDRADALDWLARFDPLRLWRAARAGGWGPVLLVATGVVACLLATYALRALSGAHQYAHAAGFFGPHLAFALLAASFLDQGAVLEEGGWRGYATPLLQGAATPLAAALVVGILWGLWHVPRDIFAGVISRLGAFDYVALYLPSFLAGTIAVSVIAAFCMNRLGGSIFPAIMIHGLTNDSIGISGAAPIHIALTPQHQITKALPLLALAAALALLTRGALGVEERRRATSRR